MKTISILFALLCLLSAVSYVRADCALPPASSEQFDEFYGSKWKCQQSRIDDMWKRFDFDKKEWNEGLGYSEPCNDALPLKRTFNALQVLAYGGTNAPHCDVKVSNILEWGYCWAGNSIDELDGVCVNDARATTSHGWTDNKTQLKLPFFYDEDVIQRASTIIHESRHTRHGGKCQHVKDSQCPRGASCDSSYGNGCSGFRSGSGKGANAVQVVWLTWFAVKARPSRTNDFIRSRAIDFANGILERGFGSDPCKRMDSSGHLFETCAKTPPPSTCVPEEEICDGRDNNCNGQVDEGVKNACGGCSALTEVIGARCLNGLRCEGTVTCTGPDATFCAEDWRTCNLWE